MAKYAIGIDYGTLSGRAVLVNAQNGQIVASAVHEYPHGVMDRKLPNGSALPQDWAIQHPKDYLDVLDETIPRLLERSGAKGEEIIAIGLDVTSSTAMPVKADGTPLCMLKEFEGNPHAYIKLWKHHAAQAQATRMTRVAEMREEDWLDVYGGKVSSEWSLPKLLEVLEEAPEVYEAMDAWVEICDWLVWQLCGRLVLSSCAAGYKRFYRKKEGHPSPAYFAAINEQFADVIEEKCAAPVMPIGRKAGGLTGEMADRLNLLPGIPVAVGMVDAHACVPAAGICKPGQMLAIIGTSTCFMTVDERLQKVPGICGAVEDGILPGCWGYEAGQSCVGDGLAWMEKHFVPESYQIEARARGMSVQQYLTELAQTLAPGESGLIALDWLGGNRSVLMDSDLTGMIMGLTLKTTPQEIYRALIEATAYGAKMIVSNYRAHGVPVDEFYVSGGICHKNAMMMQIYADVLNMPVRVVSALQGGALGSAIVAAAAAGREGGGYDTVDEAIGAMSSAVEKVYMPDSGHAAVYDRLYEIYRSLHDLFGREADGVMKRLKAIRQSAN